MPQTKCSLSTQLINKHITLSDNTHINTQYMNNFNPVSWPIVACACQIGGMTRPHTDSRKYQSAMKAKDPFLSCPD